MRGRRRDGEICLYAGWDDSVVWFGTPIPYAETELSDALVTDLQSWAAAARDVESSDDPVGAAEAVTSRQARGLRDRAVDLGGRLALEVGPDFVVAVVLVTSSRPRRLRRLHSDEPATNPAAEAAFRRLRERERRWQQEVRRVLRTGGSLDWNPSREPDVP